MKRWTDRQKETDRHIDRGRYKQTKLTDIQMERQTDRQMIPYSSP